MKFTCGKKELSEALSVLQRAVSSKSSLPALEGILIKASGNQLNLVAYDLELGISTVIASTVADPGEIVLNAKIFTDMIRKMPSDSVEISADEKYLTTIKSGLSEFTILGIPASEFPELPSLTDGITVTLSENILSSMIRQTIFAISDDDTKPIITGSLFEFSNGSFKIVSVDGARLAVRCEKIAEQHDLRFVVPGKTLSEIMRMLEADSEENITLSIGKRHILFNIKGFSIISRLLDGDFLDYKNVISSNHQTEVRVKVREFTESVDRVSLLISDRLKSNLHCIFESDSVKTLCSTTIGKAYDEISSSLTGEKVEIGFNYRYLLDALKATECDEVRIFLNGPLSPMRICPPDGDNFLFLVLPVRLK